MIETVGPRMLAGGVRAVPGSITDCDLLSPDRAQRFKSLILCIVFCLLCCDKKEPSPVSGQS